MGSADGGGVDQFGALLVAAVSSMSRSSSAVGASADFPADRWTELVGEVEQYEDSHRLCHVRGPEGIIVMLAEQIG